MRGDLFLVSIIDDLSLAIERESDHERRRKLGDARELVREALRGTGAAESDAPPADDPHAVERWETEGGASVASKGA